LWTIDISSGIFENSQNFFIVGRVSPEVFEAQNVGGPVVWRSDVFPISGDDSLEFSFDAKAASNAFETDDVFTVEIFIDGVAETLFQASVPNGNNNNMSFGSTVLTPTLQSFSTAVSGTGGDMYIQITVDNETNQELLGWDNLQLTGILTGPNVRWVNIISDVMETNSTIPLNIPVELTNYEEDVTLDVAVTGGTAEAGDYTLNTTELTFTGNQIQNVSLDIHPDADYEDEEIFLTLTENTTTGIPITPNIHNVVILDDEFEPAPTAFINELHYHETSGDNNNFVEVAISEAYTGSLADMSVYLYNGDGALDFYNSLSLNNFVPGSTSGGFSFYTWTPSRTQSEGGLKNGIDGIALVFGGNLIEFLSYEGFFMASNGPAAGSTSTDIGVGETNTTPTGNSLQLMGSCTGSNCPNGLTWEPPTAATKGFENNGQILPVQWIGFSVNSFSDKSAVLLRWSVAREENHDYYEVLHSADGMEWNVLDRVREAVGFDSLGSSGLHKKYEYVHHRANFGLNLYRIRQVDLDGAEDFSIIKQLVVGDSAGGLQLAPIPAREYLFFSWPSNLQTTSVELELISMQGRRIPLYRGETPTQLYLPKVASGIYQLRVRKPSGIVISQRRVVIQ